MRLLKEIMDISRLLKKRLLSGIVDYGLFFVVIFLITINIGTPADDSGYYLNYKDLGWWVVAWICIILLPEMIFKKSIGNFLLGLKLVSLSSGKKVSIFQSLTRHFFDLFDMGFFFLVGILLIHFTKNNQRLGDIIANTTIVEIEPKN